MTISEKSCQLVSEKSAISVYKNMLLTRLIDEKMAKLVRQNKGATFHMAVSGHEMVGSVLASNMISKKDWSFPYYRDRAFALGIGCCVIDIMAAFLARDIPNHSGGRMMPEHFSHKELKIPCQSSCVGSQFLQAVGTAKSIQLRGEDEIVYVSAGEGATSQGDFHEALNFSCIHNLPIVFVIQDNGFAISVPVKEQTAGGNFASIARGYKGLSVFEVDGIDYEKCDAIAKRAIYSTREQKGPALIIAKVPRLCPHSNSDDPKKYRTDLELEKEKLNDPIISMEKYLMEKNILSLVEIQKFKDSCKQMVEEASVLADKIPFPDKNTADTKIFKESIIEEHLQEIEGQEGVVIMDALNHALVEEMEKDSGVVVFGQDVARGKGGVFGITKGLTDRFGENRCFNTPLAESTIIGLAIGLSFDGKHKPVAEIQFADYSWTAMNQLINELSSIYYRSNGQWNCPVVIRMPYGGYIQGGPYHSQSIEGYLAHSPGLKVVIPSNAADAKMLLKTAIIDPNPVVFLEHKGLYRQRAFCARKEPSKDSYLPFGKANVVHSGSDITVIAWGMMVMMASDVIKQLDQEGISAELIDLRTIVPLDMETITASIKKTGKVLIVHEAAKNSGFGAEIAARIAETSFMDLDAPIVRLCSKDCMVPYCKQLEEEVLPSKEKLIEKLRSLASF